MQFSSSFPADLPGYVWLTTAPSGRAHTHGADDGQTGWKLHLIKAEPGELLGTVGRRPALCGLRPGTGWGLDLFIERPCTRCLRAYERRTAVIPRDTP